MQEQEKDDLLQKLKAFNPDFSRLKECLHKRNFFRILGLANLETRHSNMLAWLLDSRGNHNIKDNFVVPFLSSALTENTDSIRKRLASDNSGRVIDIEELMRVGLSDFTIDRERYFLDDKGKMRYIDLLLVSTDKKFPLVICIENKVDSLQHDGQLEAYLNYISNLSDYKNYFKLFLYLTPTKEIVGEPWIKISYKLVTDALEKVLVTDLEDDVKIFITQYYDIIRRDIMKEDLEIRKLCNDLYKRDKRIYQVIFENTIGAERKKLTDAIVDKLDELYKTGSIEIISSSNKTNNTEFKFVTKDLTSIVPYEESEKNGRVWKSKSRIVYIVQVGYNGAVPKNIYFYAVMVTGDNDKDKRYTESVLEICKNNVENFNINRTPVRSKKHMANKLVTKIYNQKDPIRVPEEIDDDFIGKLYASIDRFVSDLHGIFERKLREGLSLS